MTGPLYPRPGNNANLTGKLIPHFLAAGHEVHLFSAAFGGEYYEIYEALIKAWCIRMGLQTDDETVAKYFRLNLERGIAHLCGTGFIKNIDDLLLLAAKE